MKKISAILSGIMLLAVLAVCGGTAEATALVKHKIIREGEKITVFIPSVSEGGDKAAQDKLNTLMANSIQGRLAEFKKSITDKDVPQEVRDRNSFYSGYAVKYNKYNLFSIVVAGAQYTGGAHGIYWKDSWTMDLNSGKLYTLPELFLPLSNYKNIIDNEINKQIKERGWEQDVKFPGVDAQTKFYITEEMLVVYYLPYEIAPYVIGMPEFYIPIKSLYGLFTDKVDIRPI